MATVLVPPQLFASSNSAHCCDSLKEQTGLDVPPVGVSTASSVPSLSQSTQSLTRRAAAATSARYDQLWDKPRNLVRQGSSSCTIKQPAHPRCTQSNETLERLKPCGWLDERPRIINAWLISASTADDAPSKSKFEWSLKHRAVATTIVIDQCRQKIARSNSDRTKKPRLPYALRRTTYATPAYFHFKACEPLDDPDVYESRRLHATGYDQYTLMERKLFDDVDSRRSAVATQ